MADDSPTDVTSLTVQLLSAYLSNNTVESGDLAGLIATTRAALAAPADAAPAAPEETFEPAVSIRKSLASREHIISMIDGKPYKMLKRHLLGHGLTPAEYRARYNLPADYPVVSPAYSDQRREVAKSLGLGRKPAPAAVEPSAPPVADAGTEPAIKASATKKPAAAKTTPKAKAAPKKSSTPPPAVAAEAPSASTAKPGTTRKPKDAAQPVISQDVATPPKAGKPGKAKATAKPSASPEAVPDAPREASPISETSPVSAPKVARKAKAAAPTVAQEAPPASDLAKPAKKQTSRTRADAPSADVAKPGRAKRMARAPKASDEVSPDVAAEPASASV